MRRATVAAVALFAGLALAGCDRKSPFESAWDHARGIAADAGWSATVDRGDLAVRGFWNERAGDVLTIYLEGDGAAFDRRGRPVAREPSPKTPGALRLAIADPFAGPKAYLARPCHFPTEGDPPCDPSLWSIARFSERIIAAADAAIDAAKVRAGAARLRLVGYSGGGAVALLVAARRDDVALVVTAAGTLDHDAWIALFPGFAPLVGSLNPPDFADALGQIRQRHFAGAEDEIVPPAVAEAYMRARP
ncbi:MAG: alpha/beta hydrolase, partial [Pseudomonadota bacterium]